MPKSSLSTLEMLARAAELQDKNQRSAGESAELRARSTDLRNKVKKLKARSREASLWPNGKVVSDHE